MRENIRKENHGRQKQEREFQTRERERNKKFQNLILTKEPRINEEYCNQSTRKEDNNKEDRSSRTIKQIEATMEFIFSFAEWVDADIMLGVIYNNDKDISRALKQIHDRSLDQARRNVPKGTVYPFINSNQKSYKEVLQEPI